MGAGLLLFFFLTPPRVLYLLVEGSLDMQSGSVITMLTPLRPPPLAFLSDSPLEFRVNMRPRSRRSPLKVVPSHRKGWIPLSPREFGQRRTLSAAVDIVLLSVNSDARTHSLLLYP